MSEDAADNSERPIKEVLANNSELPANDVPVTSGASPIDGAPAKDPPADLDWRTVVALIRGFFRWVLSHRAEALYTAGLMLALALVVVGGLFWTGQGRDLLQSANDWYRGLVLFSGLTASLLVLEGLILLLIKMEVEEFDIGLLVRVSLISALIMGAITSFHNNILVGIAVTVAGTLIGLVVSCLLVGFLSASKPVAAGMIGFIASSILILTASLPNFIGDSIGSALTLTLVIVGWLFLIFALATMGYMSGKIGRGTKFILYAAGITWGLKTAAVLLWICVVGYPFLDYVRADSSETPARLQTLNEAYANWTTALPAEDKRPTLILVGAAGGGIRASFWTSLIMTHLADNVPQFREKLFASSGVSGGSLGLGVSYALLATSNASCAKEFKKAECVREFHDGDFLSGVIGATVAGLPANTLLPIFRGRDDALETSWENRWNSIVGSASDGRNIFSKPIGALWNNAKAHPLLLLNATTAATGDRAVSADVAIDWVQLRTKCKINLTQEINPRLSASIGASARFPFVSDWGWVKISHADNCKQLEALADGGFYDNYGATTLIDLINKLKSIDADFFGKFHVVVIQITSDPLRDTGCLFENLDADKTDPAKNFCETEPPQPNFWTNFLDEGARLVHLEGPVQPSAALRQFFTNVSSMLQNAAFGGGGPGVVDVALQARAATGIDVAQSLRSITCSELHGSYYHFGMTGAVDIPLGWALSQTSQDRLIKLITDRDDYRKRRLDRLIDELKTNKAQSQC